MTELRRLIDYPAVADLERASLFKPQLMAEAARDDPDTGIDEATRALFGVTTAEVEDWTPAAPIPEAEHIYLHVMMRGPLAVFAEHGWDVSDGHGKPLRMIEHFVHPLAAAIRGDAGASLPGSPLAKIEDWAAAMEREARLFRPSGQGKRR